MDPAGGFWGWDGDGGEHGAYVEGDLGEGSGVDYSGISITDDDDGHVARITSPLEIMKVDNVALKRLKRHAWNKTKPCQCIAFPPDGYCDRMHQHMAPAPYTRLSNPTCPSSRWLTSLVGSDRDTMPIFGIFAPLFNAYVYMFASFTLGHLSTRPRERR